MQPCTHTDPENLDPDCNCCPHCKIETEPQWSGIKCVECGWTFCY